MWSGLKRVFGFGNDHERPPKKQRADLVETSMGTRDAPSASAAAGSAAILSSETPGVGIKATVTAGPLVIEDAIPSMESILFTVKGVIADGAFKDNILPASHLFIIAALVAQPWNPFLTPNIRIDKLVQSFSGVANRDRVVQYFYASCLQQYLQCSSNSDSSLLYSPTSAPSRQQSYDTRTSDTPHLNKSITPATDTVLTTTSRETPITGIASGVRLQSPPDDLLEKTRQYALAAAKAALAKGPKAFASGLYKPWACLVDGCRRGPWAYKARLQDHLRTMHSIEAVMGEGIKAFPCIAKKCSHAYADTSAQRRHMDRCKFIAALITAEGLTPGFYRPFNHKAAKNQQGLVDDSDSFIDDGPDYDNVAQKDDSDDASVHYGDVADEDNLDRILFGSEEEEVDSMDDNDTILMEVPDSQEDSDSRSISP